MSLLATKVFSDEENTVSPFLLSPEQAVSVWIPQFTKQLTLIGNLLGRHPFNSEGDIMMIFPLHLRKVKLREKKEYTKLTQHASVRSNTCIYPESLC